MENKTLQLLVNNNNLYIVYKDYRNIFSCVYPDHAKLNPDNKYEWVYRHLNDALHDVIFKISYNEIDEFILFIENQLNNGIDIDRLSVEFQTKPLGYHKIKIKKGELGKFSKIKEEFEELQDAIDQENKILTICELCDLIGAIEAYSESFNLSLDDLIKMKESTKNAFLDGSRK